MTKGNDDELGAHSGHESYFSTSFLSHPHENEEDLDDSEEMTEIQKGGRRTWMIALVLVVVGAGASVCFLYSGINSSRQEKRKDFDRHASELSKEIVSSFRDYEAAALWFHEACRGWRDGSFNRASFHDLYNYVTSGGLDFFLAEWVPNITNAERPVLEAEAAAYYANDTNVNYQGFVGVEPNPEDPGDIGLFPRSEQPVYFPIQFLEPYERIGEAVHLDLYSIPHERYAIDKAIQTFKPILTERFVIVSQETNGFSVSLLHPGVPLPGGSYVEPQDLSLLLIHVRSLLARAARFQGVSLSVYLFDATDEANVPAFLGGASIKVIEGEVDLLYYNETDLESVQAEDRLCYEQGMEVGSRTWKIVVVPVHGDMSFSSNLYFATFCAILIFAASLLLAWIWVMHNKSHSKEVKRIVDKAAAESKIVSNLYPAAVRDSLIQQNTAHGSVKPKESAPPAGDCGLATKAAPTCESSQGTKPIAHLYEATTIMFADLVGFTSWSSSRCPVEVFELLEALYGAFDKIAKRRQVYKVETIGDCYVAVTGIPNPQPDHAVIMVKFARDCMIKMKEVLKGLVTRLGEDTLDLKMRVGIHSGPTTAGVLRGDKGRFQLFGDTVNTAARMESNGVPQSIHISKATANELTQSGNEHWLSPREDKITAKGKGEMQTYFVDFGSSHRGMPTRSSIVGSSAHGSSVLEGQGQLSSMEGGQASLTDELNDSQLSCTC